jgi:O-antigen/teichoic acid export membrane protein
MTDASHHDAEHRHTVRSVSLGTVWRACRYPFVVLSAILIPRLMGDTVYGEYAFFMSIYLMLDIVTDVGVTQTFGRFLPELKAEDTRKVTPFLHGMLFYGVLITLLVIVFGEGGLYLFGNLGFASSWWLLLALLLIVTKVEGSLFAFIYGSNHIGRYSSKELIRSASTFILVLGGFLLFGLHGALWALLACEVALLVAALIWTRDSLVSKISIMRFSHFWPYLLFGAKFYVPMLVFSFLQRSGNVFIRKLVVESKEAAYDQVAYFDVANQYLLLTATFLGLIFTTLLPSMTALYIRDEHDRIAEWHAKVMTYCGIVIAMTVNALVLVGEDVLTLCLGADFQSVYPNALVISLALPAVLIAYAGTNFALLEKRTHAYLGGVLLGLAAMAVVCVVLVPRMGALGASWGSVIGYSVLALVFVVRYFKEFRQMLVGLGKALLIGAVFVPCWLIGANVVVSGGILIVSTLIYAGLLLAFRIVSLEEIRKLVRNIRSS